jgi:hypothetical protein
VKRKGLFLVCSILLCLSTRSQAQTVLDPSRKIDWSSAGVVGGIPVRTTICATLSAGATAAQINSAIASCPANQVVSLGAGTYSLSSGISFVGRHNVTLRGAGSDLTKLNFVGSSGCIIQSANVCMAGSSFAGSGNPGTIRDWTAGYAKGTTQITLSNVSGLSVGTLLFLDQLDDSTDTGEVFVTDSLAYSQEGGAPGRTGRHQQQFVKVTAINGSVVTITPGVYMPNWRSARTPQAWSPGIIGSTVGSRIGLEALSIDATGETSSSSSVEIGNCYECWVKGVKSVRLRSRNHVWLWQGVRAEIRDSYFYGSAGTSTAYGVESFMSSDNLIINNIFQLTTGGITTGNAAGSVFAFNYGLDNYYTVSPTWMIKDISNHDAGIGMVLYEGNVVNGFLQDDIHGTQNFVTAFRNHFEGWQTGKNNSTVAVHIYAYNRYTNLIGNVLGRAGYSNTYEVAPPGSNAAQSTSVFSLGFSGSAAAHDTLVKLTSLRWGNYDTVTGASRFNASEVPSGLSLYANPVPADHNLPASLFLATRPSWWSNTAPWPAIGPDVAGGPGPGGHVYDIPAKLCYQNTTKTSGILNFNATACYGDTSTPGPAAPRNLRVIGN